MAYNHANQSVAVLVDGGFFLKRYVQVYPGGKNHTPRQVANNLYGMVHGHVGKEQHLYRIFYYDCIPLDKRVHNPVSKKVINFDQSDVAKFQRGFFEELKKKRKVALRLGYLTAPGNWIIRPNVTKELLKGNIQIKDLKDTDIYFDIRQKGIDMKIGVDIASLSLKKFVRQIVLVSGDADFVPASKLARREGIDFILDPMWNPINDSLFEHIDGLKSVCKRPYPKKITGTPSSAAVPV